MIANRRALIRPYQDSFGRIVGRNKRTVLGTLVERVTRYTLLIAFEAKDAETVRAAYAKALRKLPRGLARSLTYDQGKEMSGHKAFTIATGMKVYFAHPSSPWERGTNENTNGLVRQFFPKGTEFDQLPAGAIRRAQNLLNNRPRKILNYRTPKETFTALVALDSRNRPSNVCKDVPYVISQSITPFNCPVRKYD